MEMEEAEEEQRRSSPFDSLPDAVACAILSRLGSAEAVAQCAAVCRRWRLLCGCVDALSFAASTLLKRRVVSSASWLEGAVSQMLLRSKGVRELSVSYHPVEWPWNPRDHFREQQVCAWLHHVRGSLVKLVLVNPNRDMAQADKLVFLSHCTRLTWLNLCYGFIPDIPPRFRQMDALHTCLLDLILISDAALHTLVRLCPSLQHLRLNSCTGLRSPTLLAPSLLSLHFVYDMDVCDTTIACLTLLHAPKLTTMRLSYVQELHMMDSGLLELGLLCHVRPRIRDLSRLTALQLEGHSWQLDSILDLLRLAVNVTHLHIDASIDNKSPILLQHMFHHLSSLKHLFIGADMFECLQAGAERMPLSGGYNVTLRLPWLEQVTAVVCSGNKGCIAVAAALLKCSAGSLRSLRLNAVPLAKGAGNLMFFTDVLRLQRDFPGVLITLDCPYTLQ